MTEIQQLKAQVGRIEKKLDRMLTKEITPKYIWEEVAAENYRLTVSTLRTYRAKGMFNQKGDWKKVGGGVQYSESALKRELEKPNA